MVHIVFNTADVEVLRQAQALDESLMGEVLEIKDDYAVGPLAGIFSEEGIAARKQWWRDVLAGGDYDGTVDLGEVMDHQTLQYIVDKLQSDDAETLWIWCAQNKHDVCGYYWLMSQLSAFQGRVQILYLNNLPFINEKGGIFYPQWLHTIPAREFVKAKKLARAITPSEYEIDPDEWNRLCQEATGIRLLEGGKKLIHKGLEFYDDELKKFITGDWQKASKVINQFLSKAKETTGDAYLLWRIKSLIASGSIESQGNPGHMRDFEVRMAGSAKSNENPSN